MSTSRTREKADGELFKSTGIDDNATSTAVTIDANENVLVGKTSSSTTTAGNELRAGGLAAFTRSGSYSLNLNRLSSDGDIAVFQKDNTTVGSIGAKSGAVYIGTGDAGIAFNHHGGGDLDSMMPYSVTAGAFQNGAVDIGGSVNRFKDAYLSGGVYLGGTGAANKLDDYETGSWTPTAVGGMVSFTTQSAYYTKIGNLVTVNFFIDAFVTKSGSPVSIGGLPFSLFSGSNYSTGAAENGGGESMIARANNNTTNMNFYKTNSTNTTAIGTDLGGRLIATVTYRSA